jgi:hypothetical protein
MSDYLAPLAFIVFLFALMVGLGLLVFGTGSIFPQIAA